MADVLAEIRKDPELKKLLLEFKAEAIRQEKWRRQAFVEAMELWLKKQSEGQG